MGHGGAPRMENRGNREFGPQIPGIGGDGEHRLGACLE